MACITEAASGFPNASGVIPPENGQIQEILGERGLEHVHGRQVAPVPGGRDEPRLVAAQLADRPRLRALLRVPRRRDQPVVSGPRLRQPSRRPAALAGGGLPPHRGPHRQGARVHQGRQGARAREAVLPLLRAGRLPRARTTPRRSGSTASRAASTWATRRCASRRSPARRSWGSSRRTPSCRRSTRSGRPRPAPGRTASRSRRWTSRGRGTRCRPRSSGCSAGWPRSTPASWRTPTTQIGRLLDYLEETGQRENTMVVLVSDNGASGEGGPNGSVNENKFANGIPDDIEREPRDARRARRPEDLQPLPQRLGDGVQHAVQDVEALRVQRRHVGPVHHLLAGGDRRPAARSASSTTTRSTSSRRSSTRSASSRPRRSAGTSRATSTASACATASTHAALPSARDDAVLLDARLAQHLARRLEGRHHPPDDQRLEPLRQGHVGALPHRRRPLRAARPRRRRSPSGCRS